MTGYSATFTVIIHRLSIDVIPLSHLLFSPHVFIRIKNTESLEGILYATYSTVNAIVNSFLKVPHLLLDFKEHAA